MTAEMIYIIIYGACILAMLAILIFHKSQLKFWQKVLTVLLAPLMIVILIIGFIVIAIDHVIKHGFHDILPRRKSKAYPLDEADFKVWPKDTVQCGDEKMCITEYNKRFGKQLTLDDVYGNGYTESLTPEEIFECKAFIPLKYGKETNLPQYIYTDVAVAFAKTFAQGDVCAINPFISEITYLTLYKKDAFSGKQRIIDYFSNWIDSATKEELEVKVTVKWQPNQCRPAVYIKPGKYREMILMFLIKNGQLTEITFAPSHLQEYGCMFHDLDQPPFSVEHLSKFLEDNEETKKFHLSCPICGFDSNLIDWYKFNMPLGIYGYSGIVSICPDCKKVVEFLPEIRFRFETPQHIAFEKSREDIVSNFTPRLLGLYTFETEDDNIDFYSDDELQDVCHQNLKSYRETGDLDKGNDAAIIYANGPLDDYAIELFTELSEKGCHNAMLNLFTIYWSNRGDYKKAVEWLQYITGIDSPSIKCLWNLAVLNYFGDNLPHNPLPSNHIKAKAILKQICSISMDGLSDENKRVIANAKKFYPLVDKLNDFSLAGQEIHDIIKNSIVKTTDLKDKGELFYRAKALSLKSGYKLGLHIADETTPDIGDESFFYIYDDTEIEHNIYKSRIWSEETDTSLFNVVPTAMGAWQLYLLITSPTIMPVFWHGGYIVRDFIFSLEDLENIEPIKSLDFTTLNHDGLLLPNVRLDKDGKSADVYCCYWNDWEGLVREHVKIKFNSDGTASAESPDHFTIYKYDCGILF